MKLSELIKPTNSNAYILGNIFAFQYKKENHYISLFIGKAQTSNAQSVHVDQFINIVERADAFYNTNLKNDYTIINNQPELPKTLKNKIGIYRLIENDVEKDLDLIVFDLLNNNNKKYSQNFMRGVLDARSSGDTSTMYIAMDIKKEFSASFSSVIIKAMKMICDDEVQYNINVRFNKPGKKTRLKNPQFRIPYTVAFGKIGTFKYQFIEKAKLNTSVWNKLINNTDMPETFEDLIMWNTDNYPYTTRTHNFELLQGDVTYLQNYTKDTEELLYRKLKEKYNNKLLSPKNKRSALDHVVINEIMEKYNAKDFLEPTKIIEKNKQGDPLIDIHHIIPHSHHLLFPEKDMIDWPGNLVPLRQDTHYFLHRGAFGEKKIKYLETLYNEVKPFLVETGLIDKISFDIFKTMY